jgi:uncharacterized membrane protein YgcG
MDSITRDVQRMDTVRSLLSENASQGVTALIEDTNGLLLQAKASLQNGKYAEAQGLYLEANQNIPQIYAYLKTQAEASNTWRLGGYCEGLLQRMQERFRYGNENGLNFTVALKSLGYQSENQFLETLQNRIQNAQSQADIKKAIEDCSAISQMVQQMDQALSQEINRQQQGNSASENGAGGNGGSGGNSAGDGGGNGGGSGNYGETGKGKGAST